MLLPKYTIRQLMLGTVGAALFCAILGFAARGSVIAYGMGIAVLGLVIPFATFAAVYWVLVAISKVLPGRSLPVGPHKPVSQTDSTD